MALHYDEPKHHKTTAAESAALELKWATNAENDRIMLITPRASIEAIAEECDDSIEALDALNDMVTDYNHQVMFRTDSFIESVGGLLYYEEEENES